LDIINYSHTRKQLVKRILDIAILNKEGHIPSSLSIIDILYSIYSIYNLSDQLVLSKGHAALGLYTILEHFGLLHDSLEKFCQFDSLLGGHPYCYTNSKIECATGSLGHGFPFAAGLALSKKIAKTPGNIYCIIGDGEANEGTIWETAMIAAYRQINNLYCIMDYNHSGDRAVNMGSVVDKFESFGWECKEVDGHSISDIIIALQITSIKPVFILANTIKGFGVPIMHNNPEWHHKIPNDTILSKIYEH
jgi:transketolase